MKNTIASLLLTFTACLTLTSCANHVKQTESWDFVIQAKEAQLKGDELTLTTDSDHLFAFTDRPYRKFATLSFEDWSKAWNEASDSFKKDPPNAVLLGTSNKGDEKEVLEEIELMSPPLKVAEGYRFKVKMIPGAEPNREVSLGLSALYVDSNITNRRSRCSLCGRPRGFDRKFALSRIKLRELSRKGGVGKSSW